VDALSGVRADGPRARLRTHRNPRRLPLTNEGLIRRRIGNVASRAERRQPERRISVIDRHDDLIEVITTSQKLAHRIVHELKKVFRGRATYAWSDDGTLFATWERAR
jgi:hypothetical protein